MKKIYTMEISEEMYREICDEYNRRKRIRREREIISKILWGITAPILVSSIIFVISLLFLNYTEVEEWVAFGIILFGCLCGFAAYRIDPNYKKLPIFEDTLYEDLYEEK